MQALNIQHSVFKRRKATDEYAVAIAHWDVCLPCYYPRSPGDNEYLFAIPANGQTRAEMLHDMRAQLDGDSFEQVPESLAWSAVEDSMFRTFNEHPVSWSVDQRDQENENDEPAYVYIMIEWFKRTL